MRNKRGRTIAVIVFTLVLLLAACMPTIPEEEIPDYVKASVPDYDQHQKLTSTKWRVCETVGDTLFAACDLRYRLVGLKGAENTVVDYVFIASFRNQRVENDLCTQYQTDRGFMCDITTGGQLSADGDTVEYNLEGGGTAYNRDIVKICLVTDTDNVYETVPVGGYWLIQTPLKEKKEDWIKVVAMDKDGKVIATINNLRFGPRTQPLK